MSEEAKREVSLFQNTYAMIQDGSKGIVKVCVGPLNVTLSGQDRPVVFDTKKRSFVPVAKLEDAICISPFAEQGQYVELHSPAKNNSHPGDGNQNHNPPELEVGRKINVQGPKQFALWPGQVATVIPGHHLRSNQYLLCRVYDEDEARANWGKAVLKVASKLVDPGEGATEDDKKKYLAALEEEKKKPVATMAQPDLTIGKLFIIKGTDVSFFIPPTGITVIPEREENGTQFYAREALTLEQLEYAVLVDENGKKRYPRGPSVVFPAPTERFMEQKDDGGRPSKRHRAMEMNPLQGIHLKVTADFEDEVIDPSGKKEVTKHHTGEELFLTGDKYPIFFPREELAVLKYDGKTKSFATAVTKGEGRYVLNRITGKIRLEKGEQMLLPDPRTEVITLRPLSDDECALLYPGNVEALAYNQALRLMADNAPTTRAGLLSEGDANRGFEKGERMRGVPGATAERKTLGQVNYLSNTSNALAMDASQQSREQNYSGDSLERSSTYTKPRTITLGAKFQGAVGVQLWNGFAAMIVSKDGARRVEVGPAPVLLEYDEMLEVLAFSTGKPKTTDKLYRTVYLQLENFVTDMFEIETKDHVKLEIKLTYRTNFIGDTEEERTKWFSVQNYVKYLCDHAKSIVKAAARKLVVAQFYENSTEIIRDIILGASGTDGKRKGLLFEDNNLRVRDVEVLGAPIKDERIRQLLDSTQHEVVRSNIELDAAHRKLNFTKETEAIEQETIKVKAATTKAKNDLEQELLTNRLALVLLQLGNEIQKLEKEQEVQEQRAVLEEATVTAELHREKLSADQSFSIEQAKQDQRIIFLKAEAEAIVTKFKALDPNFTGALLTLSNNETIIKATEAFSFQKIVGGENISDAIRGIFAGTPLATIANKIAANGAPIVPKNDAAAQPRV